MEDVHRTIDAVWRMEAPRVIAAVARLTGDVGLAEDCAQDALVAALERWPAAGIPRAPGAWLTAAARRRAVDHLRRGRMMERHHAAIAHETDVSALPDPDAGVEDDLGDDLLRLVFIACHPVLAREARIALTLRLLGGLTTEEIARAFLVPTPTVAQRIVRAKRTLAAARIPFELPPARERAARLSSVLEVLYLVFNEGYAATAGDDWIRPELCEEAMRMGRALAARMPEEAEVHGLVALMELHASRLRARTAPDGSAILLLDQDRARWDRLLVQRGLAALARAEALGGGLGPYALQAAIAACHARAGAAEETDWARIAALYDALVEVAPSPVVALNRAVALSMAYGAEAGLEAVDALADAPALAGYHLLPAARGDMLARLGRADEARREFERAAVLAGNAREREVLRARAAAPCAGAAPAGRPVFAPGG